MNYEHLLELCLALRDSNFAKYNVPWTHDSNFAKYFQFYGSNLKITAMAVIDRLLPLQSCNFAQYFLFHSSNLKIAAIAVIDRLLL